MSFTTRMFLVIGVVLVLFVAWRGVAYYSCVNQCECDSGAGGRLFGNMQKALCRQYMQDCKQGCFSAAMMSN